MSGKIVDKIELLYVAHDYQRIGDVDYIGEENGDITGTLKDINLKSVYNDYCRKFHNHILITALKKLNDIIQSDEKEDSEIYIGCNEIRRKDKISLFMDPKVISPTEYTRINGVVGSLSIVLKPEQIKVDGMKIRGIGRKRVKVTVRFVSRYDSLKNEQQEKSYFAAKLLTYGVIDSLHSDVDCDSNNLFDFLLIDVFYRRLKEAYHKGPFFTYRRFLGNDDKLRGSIDIARHIRLNAGMHNGKVAYRYRENTINNYLNILIVKAYDHIKKKYPDIVARKIDYDHDLSSFLNRLTYDTDALSISVHKAFMENQKPIAHPFYTEYEKVRTVCLQILRDEGASIFELSDNEASGFLYYIPDLWENYLEDVFNQVLSSDDKYQNTVLNCQEEKGYIRKKNCESISESDKNDSIKNYIFISRPDFVFKKNNKNMLILDAKMKPQWGRLLDDEYSDVNEDINKCFRDMKVYQTVSTGVVIPTDFERDKYNKLVWLFRDNIYNIINTDVIKVQELCAIKTKDIDCLERAERGFEFFFQEFVQYLFKVIKESKDKEDSEFIDMNELLDDFNRNDKKANKKNDKKANKKNDNKKTKLEVNLFNEEYITDNNIETEKKMIKFDIGCICILYKYFGISYDGIVDTVKAYVKNYNRDNINKWFESYDIDKWIKEIKKQIDADTEDSKNYYELLDDDYSDLLESYDRWENEMAGGTEGNQIKDNYNEFEYARNISDDCREELFYIVPFVVPNSHFYQSYTQWKQAFKASENEFKASVEQNVLAHTLLNC